MLIRRPTLPDMDRLFADFFGPRWTAELPGPKAPPVNLLEDENNLYVEAELPGLAMEDLEIVLEHDVLVLQGERKAAEPEGTRYHRRERGAWRFQRKLHLPVEVDAEQVEARLVNGVLTVTLPKAQRARARKIEIQVR